MPISNIISPFCLDNIASSFSGSLPGDHWMDDLVAPALFGGLFLLGCSQARCFGVSLVTILAFKMIKFLKDLVRKELVKEIIKNTKNCFQPKHDNIEGKRKLLQNFIS